MQKQLITDQLIEEYQKKLDAKRDYLRFELTGGERKSIINDIDNIAIFIRSLQSLRQQEVDNVIEAYGVAKINVLTNNVRALQNGNDYFTQTFEAERRGKW